MKHSTGKKNESMTGKLKIHGGFKSSEHEKMGHEKKEHESKKERKK